jgi:hypothetical protein
MSTTRKGNTTMKVAAFVRTHEGWWCNPCIARINLYRNNDYVAVIVRRLGQAKGYFEIARMDCAGCGKQLYCIRFSRDKRSPAGRRVLHKARAE